MATDPPEIPDPANRKEFCDKVSGLITEITADRAATKRQIATAEEHLERNSGWLDDLKGLHDTFCSE